MTVVFLVVVFVLEYLIPLLLQPLHAPWQVVVAALRLGCEVVLVLHVFPTLSHHDTADPAVCQKQQQNERDGNHPTRNHRCIVFRG
jgi:hypothetical protein